MFNKVYIIETDKKKNPLPFLSSGIVTSFQGVLFPGGCALQLLVNFL